MHTTASTANTRQRQVTTPLPRSDGPPRPPTTILVWAAAALAVVGALLFRGVFVDDAYITFRFAEKIVEGDPFQWNTDGPRVEGYSNPLWMIASAGLIAIGAPVDVAVFWLSTAIIATLFAALVWWGGREAGLLGASVMLGMLIAAASTDTFWDGTLNGLETPLQALLLACFAWLLMRHDQPLPALALVAMLLIVNRFEGVIIAGLGGLSYLATRTDEVLARRFRLLGVVAVAFLVTSVLRLVVFGHVTPLSVAAKSTDWGGLLSRAGLDGVWSQVTRRSSMAAEYVLDFLGTSPYLLITLTIAALLWAARPPARRRALWVVAPPVIAVITMTWQNGGDWMPGHRLLLPYLFLLAGILPHVLGGLSTEGQRVDVERSRHAQWMIAGLAVVLAASGVLAQGAPWDGAGLTVTPTYEDWWRERGDYWDALLDDEVYIASRAGGLPYAAENLTVYDYHGLVDPCVGRSDAPGFYTGKRRWQCTFDHDPAVMDANNIPFAASIIEQMPKYEYQAQVALCGRVGQLTTDDAVFFVRDDIVPALRARDPAFVTADIERWMTGDAVSAVEGWSCPSSVDK